MKITRIWNGKANSLPLLASLAPMKELLRILLQQVTGKNFRKVKLVPLGFAVEQMQEAGIDMNTVEDIFLHGRKVESKIRRYGNYSISVSYRWDENKKQYFITSVRKYPDERG